MFRSATEMFGSSSSTSPIFLENLACSGTELTLLDCPQSVIGLHECDHSQDAGVQCYGGYCTNVFADSESHSLQISISVRLIMVVVTSDVLI